MNNNDLEGGSNFEKESKYKKDYARESIVLGFISLIFIVFMAFVGVITSIIGLILGINSLNSTNRKKAMLGIALNLSFLVIMAVILLTLH